MKKIIAIILTAIFTLTLLSGCGKKAATTSWKDAIDANAKENKYTILYIDSDSSKDTKAFKSSMEAHAEKLSDKFVFVEADYTKEKGKILNYLNASSLTELPLALIISPKGLFSGNFTKECTEAELNATIVTEKEEEIFLSMQKGLVSLLCISDGKAAKLSEVKKSLKSVETNYAGAVATHYLDTTNETDKEFISSNKLSDYVTGDISVIIVTTSGSIASTLTDDKITLTNLLSAIQSGCGSGGCGTGGCG